MSPNGWGGGGVNRKGGLITKNDFQTGGLISRPFYHIDINVLASNKVFWRRSSFCSLRRVKLQIEDLIDFVVLASKKAFHHISFNWFPSLRSSVFGLRSLVWRHPLKVTTPAATSENCFQVTTNYSLYVRSLGITVGTVAAFSYLFSS